MARKPLLSVAVVVQNHRDVVEATLTSLYELSDISFELFLIDDGSTDGSGDAIESLLDYHQHDQTFFFQHSQPAGRGNSLNEAIQQCNGTLFWAPESIHEIDEKELGKRLDQLVDSTNLALIQQRELPSSHQQWLRLIPKENWPQDGDFIWNLSALSSANTFFNPYTERFHGLELAARLSDASYAISDEAWYKPSPFVENWEPGFHHRQEILLTVLRQADHSGSSRPSILEKLQQLGKWEKSVTKKEFDNNLLNEAIQMKKDGRFNSALELIDDVLDENPDHDAARQLKIKILEKKRRFVEASELKHEVSRSQKKKSDKQPRKTSEDVKVSLIIPTTIYGKPALEHCLLSISEHCNTSPLELIVIDNASLDDTHDYLDELQEKNFLNCKVITNKQNAGFSASVNQGLDAASGEYACVIHNDIEFSSDAIGQLTDLMDAHPRYAVIGPSANKTLNPDQALRNVKDDDPSLIRSEYLDSFCMMIRTDSDLRMDENYELAFFEDIDLCFQARSDGHRVGIAPHIEVEHHFGTTTFSLDLDTESEQYWKNVAYFNDKWGVEVFSEQELKSLSTFDQLLALDDLVNPLYPEEEIKKQFEQLFTDELKTEILKSKHDEETLCKLIHLFMVMEEREVMRRLEDRLDNVDLPASLIYQLVRFYYKRNIYSRCLHYLNQLKPQNKSLRADLYRLAIHVENKELEDAIPLLKKLMEHAPANPMLYKLAGDIHRFNGNEGEAASFHQLAEQINPFDFSEKEKDAFGFEI